MEFRLKVICHAIMKVLSAIYDILDSTLSAVHFLSLTVSIHLLFPLQTIK